MLQIKEAKNILKYYGFINENIEPILCEYENNVGLFITFKTKYGHLSRCITFKSKKTLENFLKLYIWYRKEISNPDVYVEFDNYEVINPKVKFFKDKEELNNDILMEKEEIANVETLEINTTHDENLELLNIIYTKVKCFIQEAKSLESDLIDIISNYLDSLVDYLDMIGNKEEVEDVTIIPFDGQKYEENINKILTNYKKESDENIEKYVKCAIDIYNEILLDENYENDLYYLEFYKEELNKIKELSRLFDEYKKEKINNQRALKKKGIKSYEDYVDKNFVDTNISKNDVIQKRHEDVEKILKDLKNNSVYNLKKIFKIIDVEEQQPQETEVLDLNTIDMKDLKEYFKGLTIKEKTINLILSSPLKELINYVTPIDSADKYETIINEKKYYKKFYDMYEILSSDDNFSVCRKYLKPIDLDTVDGFIKSIIKVSNNIHYNTFELDKNIILKYKIGVLIDNGYLNASLSNSYPVNSKGLNNYYISESDVKLSVYYANKILTLDTDNLLTVNSNKDVITINMENLSISNKQKIKVNNYVFKNAKKNDFKLFNEKIYTISKIQGDVDIDE